MPAGALPPAPPPSPSRLRIKAGGLVSGTGRLKHVKRRQSSNHHQQPIPQQQPPTPPQPAHPLTPREQFAQFYGFTLPPPPPVPEDTDAGFSYEYERKSIHFPASIANSDSSSSASSSSSSSDRWTGSTYSSSPQPAPFYRPPPPPPQFRRSSSCRVPSASPVYSPPLDHDELLAKFNDQFVHSRTTSDTPVSPTKRERSIVPHGAEGKLLVPDVKLKVRCASSASLESAASRTPSSRRSPLSAPCSINEFDKPEVFTSLTLKRPSFESTRLVIHHVMYPLLTCNLARAWSYDNVPTYPIMQLPPKKEMRIVKKIVDGEEKEVEMEVAVFEKPKKLFLFAPKVVLRWSIHPLTLPRLFSLRFLTHSSAFASAISSGLIIHCSGLACWSNNNDDFLSITSFSITSRGFCDSLLHKSTLHTLYGSDYGTELGLRHFIPLPLPYPSDSRNHPVARFIDISANSDRYPIIDNGMLPVVAPFRTGPGRSTLQGVLIPVTPTSIRDSLKNQRPGSQQHRLFRLSSISHATKIHRRSSKLQADSHQLYHNQPLLSCFISINSSLQLVYNACFYTFVFGPLPISFKLENLNVYYTTFPLAYRIPHLYSLRTVLSFLVWSYLVLVTLSLGLVLIRVCIWQHTHLNLWAREWINSMHCGYI